MMWLLRLAALVFCLQLAGLAGVVGQEAQCVPVDAPDYGTCAGLDGDCCNLWLLECNLACSSMLLPSPAEISADQVQAFSCRGQTIQYKCKCDGAACPKSYCASSQCEPDSGSEYSCDLPCSPQEYDVQCPAGKIPRFVKSFPTCPEHTPRYGCKHFHRCEPAGGQSLSLPTPDLSSSQHTPAELNRRGNKNSAARPSCSFALLFVLPLASILTIR
jgi:hypothetical protein